MVIAWVRGREFLMAPLERNWPYKIQLLTLKTNLTKVMKSPYCRGVSLWDRLTEEVQRATTKVILHNTDGLDDD